MLYHARLQWSWLRVTLTFLSEISNKGIERAIQDNPVLASGVNIYQGHITNQGLAQSHDMPYEKLADLI